MRFSLMKYALFFLIALLPKAVLADHVVIVHPSNNAPISKTDLENLYLAKTKSFPNGSSAVPLNLKESADTRSRFESEVVGRSEAQMKSYWSRLVFTGKAVPIRQVNSDEEMVKAVASDPSAIGYVSAASVNGSVKTVLDF